LHKRVGSVAAALAVMAAVLTGCSATPTGTPAPGGDQPVADKPVEEKVDLTKLFGAVDQSVVLEKGWAVLSPAKEGARELAFVSNDGSPRLVGSRQVLQGAAEAAIKTDGDLIVVETKKEGAPQFAAFKVGAGGLEDVDYYSLKAPAPPVATGDAVVVNKYLNALWYFRDGKLVKDFRVATGRQTEPPVPTWDDYRTNFFTPEGTYRITGFVVNPPYNGLKPGDHSFAGGAPGNPLGTRWMGFSVLAGDGAGIWGIHGTSEPEKIGTWASDGCIRMPTKDAEELFGYLQGKAPVLQVVSGR
jgi:lipoprotein-anchoring transpeptidase ErfK/SrfK